MMSKTARQSWEGSKDLPVVLNDSRNELAAPEQPHSYRRPLQKSPITSLTNSSRKSADSLDSGIYSRQKSQGSMDSLESNESGLNGDGPGDSYADLSSSDEMLPPLPINQYEDYLRELQDIRQSIIIKSGEEEQQRIMRSDSGEDQDEDLEGDWLRMAGLSDLVMTSSNTMMTSQGTAFPSRMPTDLSSITVLSTLTRPQREAVLKRITSFNKAQKTKKRPKPTITSIFSTVEGSPATTPDIESKPFEEPKSILEKADTPPLKPGSLPLDGGYDEGGYPRRYSETPRAKGSPLIPTTPGSLDDPERGFLKLDSKAKHRKHVDSIVASSLSGGIEMLSISTKNDAEAWQGSRGDAPTRFTSNDSAKIPKNLSYTEAANQENLPNFSLVRDRLGITKISDLSPVDMRSVQSLALIELSALFDLRNIDLKRRKLGKNKHKETGVFGTQLTTLVEWDRKRTEDGDCRVPLVLSEIINFLENNALQAEGILRKSGSAARTKLLKQDIEERFGSNSPQDSNSQVWEDARPHDVAALLKEFLRELPDPLLTTEYIDAFQSCGLIPDRKEQLQALNLLIILLNEVHRDSLKLLLKFLGQVVVNEGENKMSLNNVAMITAPNLFISGRKGKKENTTSQDLKHAAGTSNIVRMLIKYHKLLWTIPAFMLTQVRHMNSAELSSKKHHTTFKDKTKKKKNKKDPSKKSPSQPVSQPFDYETPKGLMRVQAPNMHLTSMAVQLDNQLTSSDIIGKYQRQCERMNLSGSDVRTAEVTNMTHALYEVGGNIHERCLDVDTNMSALLKVNPEAAWFIRPRRSNQ